MIQFKKIFVLIITLSLVHQNVLSISFLVPTSIVETRIGAQLYGDLADTLTLEDLIDHNVDIGNERLSIDKEFNNVLEKLKDIKLVDGGIAFDVDKTLLYKEEDIKKTAEKLAKQEEKKGESAEIKEKRIERLRQSLEYYQVQKAVYIIIHALEITKVAIISGNDANKQWERLIKHIVTYLTSTNKTHLIKKLFLYANGGASKIIYSVKNGAVQQEAQSQFDAGINFKSKDITALKIFIIDKYIKNGKLLSLYKRALEKTLQKIAPTISITDADVKKSLELTFEREEKEPKRKVHKFDVGWIHNNLGWEIDVCDSKKLNPDRTCPWIEKRGNENKYVQLTLKLLPTKLEFEKGNVQSPIIIDDELRNTIIEELYQSNILDRSKYVALPAGEGSIDIGASKDRALLDFIGLKTSNNQIKNFVYFGDEFSEQGNDFPILKKIKGISVVSVGGKINQFGFTELLVAGDKPDYTWKIVNELIKNHYRADYPFVNSFEGGRKVSHKALHSIIDPCMTKDVSQRNNDITNELKKIINKDVKSLFKKRSTKILNDFWDKLRVYTIKPKGSSPLRPPGFLGLVYHSPDNYAYIHSGHGRNQDEEIIYIPYDFYQYLKSTLPELIFQRFMAAILIQQIGQLNSLHYKLCDDLYEDYLESMGYPKGKNIVIELIKNITSNQWMKNYYTLLNIYEQNKDKIQKLHKTEKKPRDIFYEDLVACGNKMMLSPEQVLIGEVSFNKKDYVPPEEVIKFREKSSPRVMGLGGGGGFIGVVLKSLMSLNMRVVAGMPTTDNGGSTGKIMLMVKKTLGYIFGMGDGINAQVNFLKNEAKLAILDHRIEKGKDKHYLRDSVQDVVSDEIKEQTNPDVDNIVTAKDFIWFAVNQLNMAEIVDQEFCMSKDYPAFDLTSHSIRNLNVLGVYYQVGAFDKETKVTNEKKAKVASYVLEKALGLSMEDIDVAHVVYPTFGEAISYITFKHPLTDSEIQEFIKNKKLPLWDYLSQDKRTVYGQQFIDQLMHNDEVVDFGLAKSVKPIHSSTPDNPDNNKNCGVIVDYIESNGLKISEEFKEALESATLQVFTLGAGSLFSSHLCQLAIPGIVDIIIKRKDLRKILVLNHVMMDETAFLNFKKQIQMIERIASRAVSLQMVEEISQIQNRNFYWDKANRLWRVPNKETNLPSKNPEDDSYFIQIGDMFTDIVVNHDQKVVTIDNELRKKERNDPKMMNAKHETIEERYTRYRVNGKLMLIDEQLNKYYLERKKETKDNKIIEFYVSDEKGKEYELRQTKEGDDILVPINSPENIDGIMVIYYNKYVRYACEKEGIADFQILTELSYYDQDYLLYKDRSEKGRYRGPIYADKEGIAYVLERGINKDRIHKKNLVDMVQKNKKTEKKGKIEKDRFLGMSPNKLKPILKDLIETPAHMFLTSDVRSHTKFLWSYHVFTIARAFASYVKNRTGKEHMSDITIVIGRDTRRSSPEIYENLKEGLRMSGVKVICIAEKGLETSTPLVAWKVKKSGADAGINITAGHLPEGHPGMTKNEQKEFTPEIFNGLKFIFAEKNRQIPNQRDIKNIEHIANNGLFVQGEGTIRFDNPLDSYMLELQYKLRQLTNSDKPLKGKVIVVDANNGTMCYFEQVLKNLGAKSVIAINNDPTKAFKHSLDPSMGTSAKDVIKKVNAHNADLGFIFDCDGGRLGIVDDKGRHIARYQFTMLMSKIVLTAMRVEGNQGLIVVYNNRNPNEVTKYIESLNGIPVMYKTVYGNIYYKIHELEEENKTKIALGIEDCGHVLLPSNNYLSDAAYTSIQVLAMLVNEKIQLSQIIDELSQCCVREIELPYDFKKIAFRKSFLLRDSFSNAAFSYFQNLLYAREEKINQDASFNDININKIDGARITFNNYNGFALLRPSSTRPIICVTISGKTEQDIINIAREVLKFFQQKEIKKRFPVYLFSLEKINKNRYSRIQNSIIARQQKPSLRKNNINKSH